MVDAVDVVVAVGGVGDIGGVDVPDTVDARDAVASVDGVDVVAEFSFDPPLSRQRLEAVRREVSGRCFAFDKVQLQTTFVAESGRAMFCHYKAPDAESVRIVLRQADIEFQRVWRAAVHRSTMPVT